MINHQRGYKVKGGGEGGARHQFRCRSMVHHSGQAKLSSLVHFIPVRCIKLDTWNQHHAPESDDLKLMAQEFQLLGS